jgi:hypothetical protein
MRAKRSLARFAQGGRDSMVYQYDFSDDWRHEVVLEKIVLVNDIVKTPICVGGERRTTDTSEAQQAKLPMSPKGCVTINGI